MLSGVGVIIFGVLVASVLLITFITSAIVMARSARHAAAISKCGAERALAIARRALQGVWNFLRLDGEKERQIARNVVRLDEKIERFRKRHRREPPPEEVDRLRAGLPMPQNPTMRIIVDRWLRRLFYLVLILGLGVVDYTLLATRTAVVFGGGKPPDFGALYAHVQIVLGLFYLGAAVFLLLLLGEHAHGLADPVKLHPDLSAIGNLVKFIVVVVMCIIFVVVVTLLGAVDLVHHPVPNCR